jgi:hypothetical protein
MAIIDAQIDADLEAMTASVRTIYPRTDLQAGVDDIFSWRGGP